MHLVGFIIRINSISLDLFTYVETTPELNCWNSLRNKESLLDFKLSPCPVCRYVDDTFVIWSHGQEKLMEFLNHLNGIHNKIQFTVETEEAGHLLFLDIDIYRKMDSSLGHKVYRKPTHTNLYLHQKFHHHAANKHSFLSSLVQRVKIL